MATSFTPAAIHEAMENQRWQASQASREQNELDIVSVYYTVKAKIEAGLITEARAIVAEYRAAKQVAA